MPDDDFSVRIRFHVTRESLSRVRSVVQTVLEEDPSDAFSADDVDEIVLGVQESLSNLLRHAYPNVEGAIADLRLAVRDGCFVATLRDSGGPFDPRAVPAPDPTAPRENGYGIMLLRRTMDEIHWERRGRTNHLRLVRRGSRRGGRTSASA